MKKNWPNYSIFGFRIFNSFYSILWAYIFIFYQTIITPYFGFDDYEFIAATFFVLLINLSIFILILNSIFRIKNISILFLLAEIPLLIYLPYSIKKILLMLPALRMIIN